MTCKAEDLRQIPLFALLDDDEMAVLAAQVEIKKFAPRQRIYKIGEPGKHAYVMMSGTVRVTTVDQDHQEVLVDEPRHGDFFGFASMLEDTPHQTTEADGWNGYADRCEPSVSRLAAVGTSSRQPQFK